MPVMCSTFRLDDIRSYHCYSYFILIQPCLVQKTYPSEYMNARIAQVRIMVCPFWYCYNAELSCVYKSKHYLQNQPICLQNRRRHSFFVLEVFYTLCAITAPSHLRVVVFSQFQSLLIKKKNPMVNINHYTMVSGTWNIGLIVFSISIIFVIYYLQLCLLLLLVCLFVQPPHQILDTGLWLFSYSYIEIIQSQNQHEHV